jgi:hypothetical protein
MKKAYWFKKSTENNAAISSYEKQVEDEWNVDASFFIEEEELALTMTIKD